MASIAQLRELLGKDGRTADDLAGYRSAVGNFDFPAFTDCISGSLARSVHVFGADVSSGLGLVSGFVCAVLAVLQPPNGIMWVSRGVSLNEGGAIYGPGLAAMGLDPDHVLFVTARSSGDVLWAVEEGLRSPAVGAVVCDFGPASGLDLTVTRRLALRSERSGIPAYLIVTGQPEATAARTRWRIEPALSRSVPARPVPSRSMPSRSVQSLSAPAPSPAGPSLSAPAPAPSPSGLSLSAQAPSPSGPSLSAQAPSGPAKTPPRSVASSSVPSSFEAATAALLGYPAWTVEIARNRDGACGRQVIGFDPSVRRFFPLREAGSGRRDAGSFQPPPDAERSVAPFVARLSATRNNAAEADRR